MACQEQAGGQGAELRGRLLDDHLPPALFRRTETRFAEEFIRNGCLPFRPLTYFWGSEGRPSPWRDSREGRPIYNLPAGSSFELQDPVTDESIFSGTLTAFKVDRGIKLPHWWQVFCTSTNKETLPHNFGPSLLTISNPREFVRRAEAALSRLSLHLQHDRVCYYKDDDRVILDTSAEELWKLKNESFSAEAEYRFCVTFRPYTAAKKLASNFGKKLPQTLVHSDVIWSLQIGDLSDIAKLN